MASARHDRFDKKGGVPIPEPSKWTRFLFLTYSYIEAIGWGACGIFPPFIRRVIFRLIFKRFGDKSFIDYGVYIRYPFKVSIGEGCSINRGCRFYASYLSPEAEIVIGDHVAFGPDVRLYSAGHDHTTLALADNADSIKIGNHVWIGGGAIILQGVEIGEGAVVGAGSVVSSSLPPWIVAVGNPARVIKNRTLRDLSDQHVN